MKIGHFRHTLSGREGKQEETTRGRGRKRKSAEMKSESGQREREEKEEVNRGRRIDDGYVTGKTKE